MDTQQENTLEINLRLAADEPAHRPEFFRVLLDSTIYVLGTTGTGVGEINLGAGEKIDIVHWEKQDGTPAIPFFSSLEVLQKSIDAEQSYLALPAKSLFEITMGTNLFMNPKSPYGKEFFPEEVENILSGGVGRKAIQRTTQKETEVLLGQPANYPSAMVNSLTQLLAKHQNVKRAFLTLMHDASIDEKPHLVVGIEADGNIESVFREAGNVAGDTSPDGEPVDLCRISEDDTGLSEYFISQTKPFYERKKVSKFRSIFGFGKGRLQELSATRLLN